MLDRNGDYLLKALADLNEAVRRTPGFSQALFFRGCVNYRLHRYNAARGDFLQVPDKEHFAEDLEEMDKDFEGLAEFFSDSLPS